MDLLGGHLRGGTAGGSWVWDMPASGQEMAVLPPGTTPLGCCCLCVEGMSSEQSCACKASTGHPMSDLPALSLLPEQHLCSVGGQDSHAISEGGTGDRATIGTC